MEDGYIFGEYFVGVEGANVEDIPFFGIAAVDIAVFHSFEVCIARIEGFQCRRCGFVAV